MLEILERLVAGLHVVQGIASRGRHRRPVPRGSRLPEANRSAVIAHQFDQTALQLVGEAHHRAHAGGQPRLCRPARPSRRTDPSPRGRDLSVSRFGLRLAQFEFVMRAANGVIFQEFNAAERKRIVSRLARLAETTGLWPETSASWKAVHFGAHGTRQQLSGGNRMTRNQKVPIGNQGVETVKQAFGGALYQQGRGYYPALELFAILRGSVLLEAQEQEFGVSSDRVLPPIQNDAIYLRASHDFARRPAGDRRRARTRIKGEATERTLRALLRGLENPIPGPDSSNWFSRHFFPFPAELAHYDAVLRRRKVSTERYIFRGGGGLAHKFAPTLITPGWHETVKGFDDSYPTPDLRSGGSRTHWSARRVTSAEDTPIDSRRAHCFCLRRCGRSRQLDQSQRRKLAGSVF